MRMRGASSAGTKNTRKISALEDSSEKETITGKSGFFFLSCHFKTCECGRLIVQQNKALLSGMCVSNTHHLCLELRSSRTMTGGRISA